MRPFGKPRELELRRLEAARLLLDGMSSADVARQLQVAARSVRRWRAALRSNDLAGLAMKPAPGRPPRLTVRDLTCLRRILGADEQVSGMPSATRSCSEVADIIEWQFGVRYHRAHVNRILHKLGVEPRRRY